MHGKTARDQRQQAEGLRAAQTPSGHRECPGDPCLGTLVSHLQLQLLAECKFKLKQFKLL